MGAQGCRGQKFLHYVGSSVKYPFWLPLTTRLQNNIDFRIITFHFHFIWHSLSKYVNFGLNNSQKTKVGVGGRFVSHFRAADLKNEVDFKNENNEVAGSMAYYIYTARHGGGDDEKLRGWGCQLSDVNPLQTRFDHFSEFHERSE